MNIDTIVTKITDEARAAASQTLDNARTMTQAIAQEGERDSQSAQDELLAEAKAEIARMRERMQRTAALALRRDDLVMKRQVIDDAFAKAFAKLEGMPAQQAQDLSLSLLLQYAQGDEQILFGAGDEGIYDEAFLARANEALQKAGKTGALTYSPQRAPHRGGFLLRRAGMHMEMTWEAILSAERAGLEAEVAQALFEQGGNA